MPPFGHIDCNNFYASCERTFNPSLSGRPVIVLSNNDGCAIARSNEAKALGIKMGEPAFKIKDIIEQHHHRPARALDELGVAPGFAAQVHPLQQLREVSFRFE